MEDVDLINKITMQVVEKKNESGGVQKFYQISENEKFQGH